MPTYLVCWEIEIDAETAEEAAKEARLIQLDRSSIANHFTVRQIDDDLWGEEIPVYVGDEEHVHDEGPCCECDSPDHCCCECLAFIAEP